LNSDGECLQLKNPDLFKINSKIIPIVNLNVSSEVKIIKI